MLASGPALLTSDTVSYDFEPMDISHEGTSGRSAWSWHMSPYPFTAVGKTADNHVILAVGDGKMAASGGPAGINCADLPYFMQALGCTDALKMDGGGSATMAIEGKTANDVVNYPSDNGTFDHNGERTNVNALLLVPKKQRGSGSAIQFTNNSDQITIPNSSIGNPTGDFSVEGWARIASASGITGELVNKNENINNIRRGYFIEYNYSTQQLVAGIANGNSSSSAWKSISTAGGWTAGQWHHFAMTYNAAADSMKLYVDGVKVGSTDVPSPLYSTADLVIGRSQNYTGNSFKGALDEIRIWSKALTNAEIVSQMHRNVDTDAANLTAYYKFDDFYIGTERDWTGHGYDGVASTAMNIWNIVPSYAPIAGAPFDTLEKLDANWWPYSSNDTAKAFAISTVIGGEQEYIISGSTADTGIIPVAGINNVQAMLQRKWLLDKLGVTGNNMNISFNTDSLGNAALDTAKLYYLLYRSDSTAPWSVVSTTPVTLSGGKAVFSALSVNEGWYTLGFIDKSLSNVPDNHAFNFNGSQIVQVNNYQAPAGSFSMEAWARLNATGTWDHEIINANANNGTRTGYYLEYAFADENSTGPGLKAGIAINGNTWAVAGDSTADWLPGEWHHVAMTYDINSNTMLLYKDGKQVASKNLGTASVVMGTQPLGIGGSAYYTGNGWNGAIDEVRIWHKVLSPAEIQDHMHTLISPAADSLSDYFTMDVLNADSTVTNQVTGGLPAKISGTMSSASVISSYAPINTDTVAGFHRQLSNWYAQNNIMDQGLRIVSAYAAEPSFVLHAANNNTGAIALNDSLNRLNRLWNFRKIGAADTVHLQFMADSLGIDASALSKVYLLNGIDSNALVAVDSITMMPVSDTIQFSRPDTSLHFATLAYVLNSGTALPVTLLNFTGTKHSPDVVLDWNVAVETGVKNYTVQRSPDGSSFQSIGTVAAKGSNSRYTVTDTGILNSTDGAVYYKLKIADVNGQLSYSRVVSVTSTRSAGNIELFPNPFTNTISIKGTGFVPGAAYSVKIVNPSGQVLFRGGFRADASSGSYSLTGLQGIASGIYNLVIEGEGRSWSYKLIRK